MPADAPAKLRFRWKSSYTNPGYAIAEVRTVSSRGRIVHREPLKDISTMGKWKVFFMNPFVYSGKPPVKIYVIVRLYKTDKAPLGQPSNYVVINYHKPSTQITEFKLDTLRILSVVPDQGSVTGPPASVSTLTDADSLTITYFYELVTLDEADIRQWLLTKNGTTAPNNYWTWDRVKKGKGQVQNKATIRCKTPTQGWTHVYGIEYVMHYGNTTLVEGKEMFSKPIFFRCANTPKPDRVKVISTLPPGGSTIYGPYDSKNMNDSNSIKITYEYELYSTDKAEIRQWALDGNGKVIGGNFWTFAPLDLTGKTDRKGTAQTNLTILCSKPGQGPTYVKGLKVLLRDAVTKKKILKFNHPVNYTFKCMKIKILKTLKKKK